MRCVLLARLYTVAYVDDVGLDRIVLSIEHCGCSDPGSIPGLVIPFYCKHSDQTVFNITQIRGADYVIEDLLIIISIYQLFKDGIMWLIQYFRCYLNVHFHIIPIGFLWSAFVQLVL